MHIIPVIDVKGGVVVAARRGDRANYMPLETPLAKGSDPLAVARGLLALFPFKTLYIADLDGIEGRGAHVELISKLAKALPEVSLWIDNGAADEAAVAAVLATARTSAVIGSETGVMPGVLAALDARFSGRIVLSLDFKGETFLGDPRLLPESAAWPGHVIAMTLARVGSGEGPDLKHIEQIAATGELRKVYAAGGIRNAEDLKAARSAGAAGALIATALHAGMIGAGDIEGIHAW